MAINTRIKHKIDTDENWSANNPLLLNGEVILVETNDGVKMKVGDGSSNYNDIPFFANNFVTQEYLQEVLTANFGFASTEDDMLISEFEAAVEARVTSELEDIENGTY